MRNCAFIMDSISVVVRTKWFTAFAHQARLSSSSAASRNRNPAAASCGRLGVWTVVMGIALRDERGPLRPVPMHLNGWNSTDSRLFTKRLPS